MNKVTLVNQTLDTGDDAWGKYSCGICVLKMLMVFRKPELHSVSVKTLIDQALERKGYIENIGWRHQTLIDLAGLYGVPMGFQKEFFNTPERKKEGIKIISKKLKSGLPVAASVLREFSISNSAHLVLINGLAKVGPFVTGYKIVDSYPGRRGNRYTVSKKEFLSGWRGGMIWLR